MSNNIAVSVKNLNKVFIVSDNPVNTIKQLIFNFSMQKKKKEVKVLDNLSFEIIKGEKVGFIGRNGSGKSTLTKVITGIYPPTSGKVTLDGSIMLMNLGLGINQELSARENVYIVSSILGHTIAQTDHFFDELIDFAELREFVNRKVKYFSSGMQARLSFSIALYAKADIIILDEVFSVGDAKFMQKATLALEDKILKNSTIILISHDEATIRKYCNKVGYLKNGKLDYFGDPEIAIQKYHADNQI